MSPKKTALLILVTTLAGTGLVVLHAVTSTKRYLCEEVCGYVRYSDFLGVIFLSMLLIASVALVRLLTSHAAFRTWKRSMLVFVPLSALFALPAFTGGGGGWGISAGPDSEVTMWMIGIVYGVMSGGIIVWFAIRERR